MDLTIHNALHDKTLETVHLGIQDGKINKVSQDEIPPGERSIDAKGAMVSPALIEPHFHIENALLWDTENLNNSGTLLEAIDIRQTTLVVTLALALGLTFLALNLFLDISYRFIDPRVREIQ